MSGERKQRRQGTVVTRNNGDSGDDSGRGDSGDKGGNSVQRGHGDRRTRYESGFKGNGGNETLGRRWRGQWGERG